MKTLFSTEDVHPRDRFDYWHEVACRLILKHDSQPQCRLGFHAALQTGALADVGLILFENSPMDVARLQNHVALETSDELLVLRQISGALALEQDGREVILEPGDIALLDPLLPYLGKFFPGSNLLVVKTPRSGLEARVGDTREMLAHRIRPSHAEGSLTSSYLAMLPSHAGRMRPATDAIVRDQLLDLIAVSLAKVLKGNRPRVSSARSLALMNIRAAIEARLTDPSLDAGVAAAAARISVRYANSVLAREGTSVRRLIQARRLERCRIALEDPSQAHRTLTEIAFGWGFSDMTHFSRRFKAAYGVLPSEYRRLAKESRLGSSGAGGTRPDGLPT